MRQCLLKKESAVKDIDDYSMNDVEWKLGYGGTTITLNSSELRKSLLGEEKLIKKIFDEAQLKRMAMYYSEEDSSISANYEHGNKKHNLDDSDSDTSESDTSESDDSDGSESESDASTKK